MNAVSEMLRWVVLTIIVGSTVYGDELAIRFLGAAGIWVGIMNAFAIMLTIGVIVSKDLRKHAVELSKKRGALMRLYLWIAFFIEMVIYAYAGWLWTFGIRVVYQIVGKSVSQENIKEIA